jgi:hypothetical protein
LRIVKINYLVGQGLESHIFSSNKVWCKLYEMKCTKFDEEVESHRKCSKCMLQSTIVDFSNLQMLLEVLNVNFVLKLKIY